MANFMNKARKSLGFVSFGQGTNYFQQQMNNYNNQINAMGQYNDNTYANALDKTMRDILNGKDYSWGGNQAMSQYARDYSMMAGLGTQAGAKQVSGLAGGYGNDYTGAVASQGLAQMKQRDNTYNLNSVGTVGQIGRAEDSNQLNVAQNIGTLGQQAYQQWADKINALMNGRELEQSAYNKLQAVDRSAYTDAQKNALADVNYGLSVQEAEADRAYKQHTADQDYALTKLKADLSYQARENDAKRENELNDAKNIYNTEVDNQEEKQKILEKGDTDNAREVQEMIDQNIGVAVTRRQMLARGMTESEIEAQIGWQASYPADTKDDIANIIYDQLKQGNINEDEAKRLFIIYNLDVEEEV